MSDAPSAPVGTATAGRMLRDAREAQRLTLAALASAIKVTPRKLELLEADRYDQLLDPTFTRALAQTVCRTLKIDSAPVLALLPRLGAGRLAKLGETLNTPYREAAGRDDGSVLGALVRPAALGPLLLLLLAAAVYLTPRTWFDQLAAKVGLPARDAASRSSADAGPDGGGEAAFPRVVESVIGPDPSVAPAGSDGTSSAAVGGADTVIVGAPASAPPLTAPAPNVAAAVPAAADAAAKPLKLRVSAPSWIEVVDARGQLLLSRTVEPGEDVGLDGALPLRVRIGNAKRTEVVFRGQPFSLAPFTRENLARLELK